MDTLHRRLFGSLSRFFEVGGPAGMKADPSRSKKSWNYPELSWKSTTCVAIRVQPQITTKRALDEFGPLGCHFPYPKLSKNKHPRRF
jgi:hypothetical protein